MISSGLSTSSEASASEFVENLDEMFAWWLSVCRQ